MKKSKLIVALFLSLNISLAQVVFCPLGAEWRGLFSLSMQTPNAMVNSSIKYTHDTLINNVSYKVLTHQKFYNQCNLSNTPILTLIKQAGDTVFFRNSYTYHTWELLYNYAAQPTDSWLTTVQSSMIPGQNITYTTTVNSIQQLTENNINLKRLNVTVKFLTYTQTKTITERYGMGYLFDFHHLNSACHGDRFVDFLCYSDLIFGTKTFSDKSCDFSNPLDIKENTALNSNLLIYPNPASSQFIISVNDENVKSIQLFDLSGKRVLNKSFETHQTINTIDVSHLSKGLYIAQIQSEKGKQFVKIVKE